MVERTSEVRQRSRLAGIGMVWLVIAVPGLVLGVVAQLSDDRYERAVGYTLLVLGALAAGIGLAMRRSTRRVVATTSLAISALWIFGAIAGLIAFTFLADRLVFGAFPAVAGILTGLLIYPAVRRPKLDPIIKDVV